MHIPKEITTNYHTFCFWILLLLWLKKKNKTSFWIYSEIYALLSVIGQGLLNHGQLMVLACNQMLKRTDGLTKSDLLFYLSLCCPLIMQVLNIYAIQLEEQENV